MVCNLWSCFTLCNLFYPSAEIRRRVLQTSLITRRGGASVFGILAEILQPPLQWAVLKELGYLLWCDGHLDKALQRRKLLGLG